MKSTVSAFIAGLVFGLGLILSEMVNPQRVRGFLDIAGNWDPTLVFVMGGAVLVTAIGFRLAFLRSKPWFSNAFAVPTNRLIDSRLVLGAVMFGVGWGIAGFCPGPAIVGLATLNLDILIFVLAMIAGMKLVGLVSKPPG
jgi:uncharacterized membrane protein YedE/YeeE